MHNSRKPERTIHIAPCGSASLVKSSQKTHSIPKELHHSIQHVRTSLNNLNREMELFVNSKKDLKINNGDICDASGDEEGILAIRTCKSREDRLPPIDTVSNIHIVDILNPKTPQTLYYTNIFNVSSEQDTTDGSSSSSSEGFLPPNQSASKKPLPLTHLVDHQYTKSVNVEDEIAKPSDTVKSRSHSPPVVKVSGQQQRSLKEFSVKVVKLPQSVITSRNTDSTHHGIYNSEHIKEICKGDNLISNEDMEMVQSASDVNNQRDEVLTEHSAEPTTGDELLCEESVEFGTVSCTEADNGISKDTQDEKDDHYSLSTMDCDDDYNLQNVAEVTDYGNSKEMHLPSFQRDCACEAKSKIAISSPNSNYENDDEFGHEESVNYQENFSKQHTSKVKSTALPNSDTECKESVEFEKTLTATTSSKDTIKKHSKKVKSEKYVVSSCSEGETHIHSEKSTRKRSIKQHKSGFQNNTSSKSNSNIVRTGSSDSQHEEFPENFSLREIIKSEEVCVLPNPPQSNRCMIISSCSEHEETEMRKRKKSPKDIKNKIPAFAAKQSMSSSSEHSFSLKHSHGTDNSVSHTKITTETPISVKRKLNMTEEVITEGVGGKGHATKYKLRSKGNN